MKHIKVISISLIAVLFLLCGFDEKKDAGMVITISGITAEGNLCLDISRKELEASGIEQSDIVKLLLNGKEYLTVIDYDAVFEYNPGKDYISCDGKSVFISRKYRSFADKEDLEQSIIGESIEMIPVEKGAYIYQLQDAAGLDKKTASNFRCVNGGGLGEGILYRSCSPVVTDYGEERRAAADRLLREYRIDYVINLSENLAELTERVNREYPQSNYLSLIDQGTVSANELDWADTENPKYEDRIAAHFRYIAEHDGSYLVHCAIGQDRTGFFIEVLASLMGASYEELIEDYGKSFENYYSVERGSVLYQYLTEGGLRDSLQIMTGESDISEYVGADGKVLEEIAAQYLLRIGLTEEEVKRIQNNLSKDGKFGSDTLSCEDQIVSDVSLELSADLAYYKGDVAGTLRLENQGASIVDLNGQYPLHIGISLLDESGEVSNLDYKHLELGEDGLARNEVIYIDFEDSLQMESGGGFRISLVQENAAWLDDYVDYYFVDITVEESDWQGRLYFPTQISKIGGWYVLEDCWHHRILYSDHISDDLLEWHVLTDDVMGGHSAAGDEEMIVVDDTDHDRILVFDTADLDGSDRIAPSQMIDVKPYVTRYTGSNHTARPHYVFYDQDNEFFLVPLSWGNKILAYGKAESVDHLSAKESELEHISENDFHESTETNGHGRDHLVYLSEYELESSAYVKFISCFDDGYWLLEGDNLIRLNWINGKLEKTKSVPLPECILNANVNYVCKIQDTYYLSSWEDSGLYVCESLENLTESELDLVGPDMGIEGIPYYISSFDDSYWICEVGTDNGIAKFEVDDSGMPVDSVDLFRYGAAEPADLLIKRQDDVIA